MNDHPIIPIHPVTEQQFEAGLDFITGEQQRWLAATGFTAAAGSMALLPGVGGDLERVLAGIDAGAPLGALAGLPARLPALGFRLETDRDPGWRRQALIGWHLGAYRFQRYRAADDDKAGPVIEVAGELAADVQLAVRATTLVRDLINTPTEDMGPEQLEHAARELADEFDADFSAVSGSELEEHFPAIHMVGRASHRAPRLLRLSRGHKSHPRVAVLGKGVCFDTGGLNIKRASGMLKMKKDMGGAAHALGLAQMVMAGELSVRLEVYLPAVENAIAGNAYRPGDVLKTRSGLNIEITNTDAEGRLVLADALALASEHEPELMIDFATLTGAARVALGPDLPVLFCNDEPLRQELQAIGRELEDPLWPLPLYQPYLRLLKSEIADYVNASGSSHAGAISAALFLERFVDPGIRWCHFDTYGWNDESRPGRPAGGEAMGIRAAFELLRRRYQ